MPENTDISCKGSRFSNVISSNVIYIGQTNDEKPVKCSKTCAQRGSWANPVSSTREALAVAENYFGTVTRFSLIYLPGRYDDDELISSTEPIRIPDTVHATQVLTGGSGTVDLANPGGYSTGTGDGALIVQGIHVITSWYIGDSPGVGATTLAEPNTAKEIYFNQVHFEVNDPVNPAVTLQASSGKLAVNFVNCLLENTAVGGTVVSQSAEASGQLASSFQGCTSRMMNGTFTSNFAADNGNFRYSGTNHTFTDLLAEISSSDVPAFQTLLSGSSTATLTFLGNSTKVNVKKGIACCVYKCKDSSELKKNIQNQITEHLGEGVLYENRYDDDAFVSDISANISRRLAGPKTRIHHNSSKKIVINNSQNICQYIGTQLLDEPASTLTIAGSGGVDSVSNGNSDTWSTALDVPVKLRTIISDAMATFSSSGDILENTGLGGGRIYDNQADGAMVCTQNGGSTTVAGTAQTLKNTEAGKQTYQSSAHRYTQTGSASLSTRVKTLAVLSGTVSGTASASSLVRGNSGATHLTSIGEFFASEQDESVGFSLENTSAGSLLANISASMADLGTGTVIQHRGSGTGSTMVNAISTIIQSAETFLDSQSTDEASASISAATTATLPNGALKAFSKAVSDSTNPTTVTATGASFDGTTQQQALFEHTGHVAADISNFKANLTGDDDRFFHGKDLIGGVASTLSSSRITRASTASTKALVEASGDGTPTLTASDVAAVIGSGSHVKVDGLERAGVKLSNFSKLGVADESPLMDVNNMKGKLSILASTLSSDKGHGIATVSNVIAEIQASSTTIAEGYANYKNDGGSLAEFAAAQSNGITKSLAVLGADIKTIANKFVSP